MSLIKKKRVSKKTKLAWRKHVNIEDVENYLEEKRLEERLGKPIAEKTNDELFTVDTSPNKSNLTSKQKRRLLLKQSTPKCFSMLQPHSEVPDPVIKRNRVRTKEERKNELVKKKEIEMRRKGILKAKELQSEKDRLYELKKNEKAKVAEFDKDLWNSEDKISVDNEWIAKETVNHTLRGTNKLKKTIPKSVRTKASVLPTVEPPHPGTSYNPSFLDHQELLKTIVEKEEKIIKEEKHLNRVTRSMFTKLPAAEKEQMWLSEMSEGLEKAQLEEENGGDYKSVNPPVKNKKKDLKQRRKQKEQQQMEQARKAAKKEKKKIADIHKLKFLKNQIDKREKKAEILRAKWLQKAAEKDKQTKRLSSLKFEEQEIDCSMPQDLSGNLRNIKKEGDLLKDRFKSLQKRNILQPTTKHVRTRAKIKRYQKPGFKDDWKVTVARAKGN